MLLTRCTPPHAHTKVSISHFPRSRDVRGSYTWVLPRNDLQKGLNLMNTLYFNISTIFDAG